MVFFHGHMFVHLQYLFLLPPFSRSCFFSSQKRPVESSRGPAGLHRDGNMSDTGAKGGGDGGQGEGTEKKVVRWSVYLRQRRADGMFLLRQGRRSFSHRQLSSRIYWLFPSVPAAGEEPWLRPSRSQRFHPLLMVKKPQRPLLTYWKVGPNFWLTIATKLFWELGPHSDFSYIFMMDP